MPKAGASITRRRVRPDPICKAAEQRCRRGLKDAWARGLRVSRCDPYACRVWLTRAQAAAAIGPGVGKGGAGVGADSDVFCLEAQPKLVLVETVEKMQIGLELGECSVASASRGSEAAIEEKADR